MRIPSCPFEGFEEHEETDDDDDDDRGSFPVGVPARNKKPERTLEATVAAQIRAIIEDPIAQPIAEAIEKGVPVEGLGVRIPFAHGRFGPGNLTAPVSGSLQSGQEGLNQVEQGAARIAANKPPPGPTGLQAGTGDLQTLLPASVVGAAKFVPRLGLGSGFRDAIQVPMEVGEIAVASATREALQHETRDRRFISQGVVPRVIERVSEFAQDAGPAIGAAGAAAGTGFLFNAVQRFLNPGRFVK